MASESASRNLQESMKAQCVTLMLDCEAPLEKILKCYSCLAHLIIQPDCGSENESIRPASWITFDQQQDVL